MRTILFAAALAALAASVALGCQGGGPSKPSAGDPPAGAAAPPQAQAPSAAPTETQAPPAASPTPPPAAPAGAAAAAPPSKAYAGDIEKLCDVVRLSGAEHESPEDRRLPIANWLAANLTTTESRQFLARIQPLVGEQKADALEAEARRVGLSSCSLAAEWRLPPR